ncbi:MAG: hypothetical protein J7L91_03450 [Candidatus Korarchaeota archaeon]|nr:hypothetical protein [Candidatus Korarchaeota archaeon]
MIWTVPRGYEFLLEDLLPDIDPLLGRMKLRVVLGEAEIVEVVPPIPFPEDDEDPEEDAPRPDIDLPPGVDPRDEPDCDDEEEDEEENYGISAGNSHFPRMEEEKLRPPFSPFYLREGVR